MSPQADFIVSNGTGAAVRSDLNVQFAAIVSNNSGATEPATMYAYQWWADTTTGLLKLRNSANSAWISLRELDGTLLMEDGTAAAPGLSFASDPDSGIFRGGANEFGIATNGVERVEFGTSEVVFNDGGANYDFRIEGDTNTSLFFVDASAEAVGIGDSAPDALLVIKGNSDANTTPSIRLKDGTDTREAWITNSAGDLALNVGGDDNVPHGTLKLFEGGILTYAQGAGERLRIDSSGRLLVGTSTARSNFYNTGAYTPTFQLESTAGSSGGTMAALIGSSADAFGAYFIFAHQRSGTIGGNTIVNNSDTLGAISFQGSDGSEFVPGATIEAAVDGTPGANSMPGRIVLSTTAAGASSPTERMRISSQGQVKYTTATTTDLLADYYCNGGAIRTLSFEETANTGGISGTAGIIRVSKNNSNNRSVNATGTINASGADYAEYMTKSGIFDIAKGAICGVNTDGLLTLNYGAAVNFAIKSTNPSYVGNDTWCSAENIGKEPDIDDVDALAQWKSRLEAARINVDRVAFAGQVPVNVTGATPGQYIVPVESADGGIEGIAKDEADLTLTEYMRAVGKVIAIEDDGRARVIVKVA
jgi:hypothetical protein